LSQESAATNEGVPNSLAQVITTTKYAFLDYFRSRRFLILVVITLLISGLLTALVGYYRPASFLDSNLDFYGSWWGGSINFVVVLSAIFFGGDAISGEFQNKTGYFFVPNPIRRSSIYVGKWLAALFASVLVTALYVAITLANSFYYFGPQFPSQFAESILFALFYLVSVLGFTFFFSSLFKSTTYSLVVTAILFLFAFNLISTLVSTLVKIEPWFILTYGAGIIGNVLSTVYPQHVITNSLGPAGRFVLTTYNATIPEGLLIIGVYFVVTAILGLLLFERKEFN
jgi:ABC-2 type transport system permease protein